MRDQARERLIIGSLALVATLLAVAPWWLRYAANPAPLVSATVLAAVLVVAALLAKWRRVSQAAAFALAAGAWALLSPLLFGFWDEPAAFWSHITAGVAALLLSAGEIDLQNREARTEGPDAPGRSEERS
jgi:hypothetical protein